MILRLFIEPNVMLDLLGKRVPFYDEIAKIATLADRKEVILVTCSLSFATVSYLLSKYDSAAKVKEKLRKFKIISEVANLDEQVVEKGLNSSFPDFEDALQYHAALAANCDLIITRNGKDFKKSQIPVMTAGEFLASINKR